MPTLRPDSIFSEFAFTQQELIAARMFNGNQICYLQTLYAQTSKQKLSTPVPEAVELDRDYFCKMAELEGRLSIIQQLLDGHKEAMKDLSNPDLNTSETTSATNSEIDTLATRASNYVNQQ